MPFGIIGRAGETLAVQRAFAELREGRGASVHLAGEAGIGKTTITRLIVEEATSESLAVRTGGASENDHRRAAALARTLVPEAWGDGDTTIDVTGALLAAVERIVTPGPVVLVAEDLHWADEVSLDALAALVRRAGDLGILVVTSARSHPTNVALLRLEEAVDRHGTRLDLAPFGPAELAELTASRLGASPGPELTALLVGTGGNPFLATELLGALHDRGDVVVRDGVAEVVSDVALPERLVDRLVRRTIVAAGGDGVVARAVAVLAGAFTAEEMGVILDRPALDVLTSVLALTEANIFTTVDERLLFRHELIGRAVLDATPRSVVRGLNRRGFELVGDEERRASCLLASYDPRDPADITRLIDAGLACTDTCPLVAVDLLRAGLGGLPPGDERYVGVVEALGWVLADLGRAGEVGELLVTGFEGTPGPYPLGIQRLVGHVRGLGGDLAAALQPYAGLEADALMRQLRIDSPQTAHSVAELALLHVMSGHHGQAAELLAWVDASGVALSPRGAAFAGGARAWLHAVAGEFDDAERAARRGVDALADDHTVTGGRARPVVVLAIVLDALGRSEESLALLGPGDIDRAPRWNRALAHFASTVLRYRRGEWDDAMAEVDAGLAAAAETDFGMAVCWPLGVATLITTARGELGEAARWLKRAEGKVLPRSLGADWVAFAMARFEEASGRPARAESILRHTLDAVLRASAPALLINFGIDAVRIGLERDRKMADRAADGLVDVAARSTSPVMSALARWGGGLRTRDPAVVEAAAAALDGVPRPIESARAYHDAALLALHRGDAGEARRLAGEAFVRYDRLGADLLHRQLRAALRGGGLSMRPRRAPTRPAHGWHSLTDTEATIVELVGSGLTNSEIGGRLYVSRRTVESHLGRVYGKLALRNRAELVAGVHAHGNVAAGPIA